MIMNRTLWVLILVLYLADVPAEGSAQEITIGSKVFTESVILGEMISQLSNDAGAVVDHKQDLGGTQVLWQALLRGDIDVYPEYTGTISQEILAGSDIITESGIRSALEAQGIRMSRSLGFNNTYVIGMKRSLADSLDIRTISDLRRHPGLTLGFSIEFMDREDGWPGLRNRFALTQQDVFGLEHTLAYQGLESGSIHATDLYSTDAEISYYDLAVLEDDLNYFPAYRAVLLYRSELEESAPAVVESILRLQDMIGEIEMVVLNARAKIDGVSEPQIASEFLAVTLGVVTEVAEDTALQALIRNTIDHLWLVGISLAAAILLAIPLGIFAARKPGLGQTILAVVGVIQTIPSLALLVFMIPVLGIGGPPAMMALFLYSLLPIVRNTYSGLTDIPKPLLESAEALGLPASARLRLVELPTASRTILAGIKTSAVINVGTATLGAIIGAGGYGQPILTGIRLDDLNLILQGAVPAAVLALLVQGGFELAERIVVPKGLRLASG
jgi:osmoprotectant transport system permease protein